jgi:protoporphyrinogen oxidase
LGWYLKRDDKLMNMEKDELVKFVYPYLKKINSNCSIASLLNCYMFKAPFAQPIFDKEFVKNKPDFITPVNNFFIANLDMTYPYDRGTNYAVKLGKEVAELI